MNVYNAHQAWQGQEASAQTAYQEKHQVWGVTSALLALQVALAQMGKLVCRVQTDFSQSMENNVPQLKMGSCQTR